MPYGSEGEVCLGEMIARLEREPSEKVIRRGFLRPHSYRGFYEDLAFEPVENVPVRDMLECAKASLGKTYQGYKGGNYNMDERTSVWIAVYGDLGEPITPTVLECILMHG